MARTPFTRTRRAIADCREAVRRYGVLGGLMFVSLRPVVVRFATRRDLRRREGGPSWLSDASAKETARATERLFLASRFEPDGGLVVNAVIQGVAEAGVDWSDCRSELDLRLKLRRLIERGVEAEARDRLIVVD